MQGYSSIPSYLNGDTVVIIIQEWYDHCSELGLRRFP